MIRDLIPYATNIQMPSKRFFAFAALAFVLPHALLAVDVEEVPLKKLSQESDVVVIVQPADIGPSKIQNPSLVVPDDLISNLMVVKSTFKVDYVIKGKVADTFALEHFRDRRIVPLDNAFSIMDIESRPRKIRADDGALSTQKLRYLLFLKRLDNGNFRLAVRPEWMEVSVRIVATPF